MASVNMAAADVWRLGSGLTKREKLIREYVVLG